MKYSGLIMNDIAAAPGLCVSFYVQGCPHRCKGCHNPSTWGFEGGEEFTLDTLNQIVEGLTANGIQRSLCILGGEPLCEENEFLTHLVIKTAKDKVPNLKVYIWTGYLYEQLKKSNSNHIKNILSMVDCIIDGPYVEEERDITLPMRGSRNQRIIYLDKE